MVEILAPVGGTEQLEAAVRSGANAVYLGTKSFNARRSAENFDEEALKNAVRYCHARNVAVHVTLNTIITDKELKSAAREIEMVARCGVDAVIVQDMAVATLVKKICPQLPMHASTQLSTHNAEGALLLKKAGFSRVVLARECSKEEIKDIIDKTGMEVEIFVHGAHCMSFSGNCYMSAMFGERSGNRGMCAQPCRLNFKNDRREYALSLKDMSLIDHMQEIIDMGVTSLKIEGRMKRPEYVAAAVTACVEARRGDSYDKDALTAVFSRSGFTDGYFTAQRNGKMFGYRRKEDVLASEQILPSLTALYRGENPVVPVKMVCRVVEGEPVSLTVTDGTHTVSEEGIVPEAARNRAVDEEFIKKGLSKTGGTPFFAEEIKSTIGEGLSVPLSAINQLRKACLDKLLAERSTLKKYSVKHLDESEFFFPKKLNLMEPSMRVRLNSMAQFTPEIFNYAEKVIIPVKELFADREITKKYADKIIGELPLYNFKGRMESLKRALNDIKALGIKDLYAGTIGSIAIAENAGFNVYGGAFLNVLNSMALNAYRDMGVCDMTVSFEGNLKNIRRLGSSIPVGIIAYGYLPLMCFRSCPARSNLGCEKCTGSTTVTDRKGNEFPLMCHEREYSSLHNPIPLYLGDKKREMSDIDFYTLYFTKENKSEVMDIIEKFDRGMSLEGKKTGGLYFRDIS